MRSILIATFVVAKPFCAFASDKLNAAYINDRPAPFGGLTLQRMKDYGATSFNRFNMMSVTFELDSGAPGANPLVFGNAQPLASDWTVPAAMQDAVTAIAALKASGAQVFVSAFGAYDADVPYLNALSTDPLTADASVCAAGGSGVGNVNCTIFYLDKFLSGYGFDGLDIDIEGWNGKPFEVLVAGLGQNPWFTQKYGVSFAPYVDTGAAGRSVLDGACAFQVNGVADYLDARQYYAGGALNGWGGANLDDVPNHVTQILQQAQTYACPDGSTLKLDAAQYVIGISPYSVLGEDFPGRGGPNNCEYYYDKGFPDCASVVAKVVSDHPDIAGTFVWTIGLLDWTYYSCYIDNALNGHTNDCGTPKPVPQDQ